MAAAATGAPAAPLPPQSDRRLYTQTKLEQGVVMNGVVENPDAVIRQFGSWEGLAFYERMLRQFPFLYGICMQWIARINAIDRAIKPGDPNSEMSVQMAKDAASLYRRLDGKEILNEQFLWGNYYGISVAECVWGKDDATGLRAPTAIYNLRPWSVKFTTTGDPLVLTVTRPMGEPVDDPRRLMVSRWGSLYSDYGDGRLKFAYGPTWYIQQFLRMQVNSIERYGRPIPWMRYNELMDDIERGRLEASLKAQFKNYVMTPSSEPGTKLEFPAGNIAASGTAGNAERTSVEYMVGWCYIALLGTQQTQDSTGGSRALEETRRAISGDQTPPGSTALDTLWTKQYLDRIGEENWRNQPRELWPRMDSDVDDDPVTSGIILTSLADITARFRRGELGAKETEELLVRGGIGRPRAREILQDDFKATAPAPKPSPFGAPQPPQPDPETPEEEAAPGEEIEN